jgi:acyl-CoA thioesterase-1
MKTKRKTLTGFGIALLVVLAGSIGATAQTLQPSVAGVIDQLGSGEAPVRVVCFGDSITGIYYHTGSQRAWTDLFGIALRKHWPAARVEMTNAGLSGNTTAQALTRMERDVLAKKPHLVAVMFGMNDVVKVPLRDYVRNLEQIADRCQRAGAAVIFCTPNSVTENPDRRNAKLAEYAAAMRRVAASRGWPLADAFGDWEALRQRDAAAWALLMSETIHPNLNGQRRFAELFASALAGEAVTLTDADVPPAADPLAHTLARLEAGQPVKIVAMAPYDRIVPERLKARYPDARLEVFTWPVTEAGKVGAADPWTDGGRTAAKGFGKQIREMRAQLVIVAPPAWINEKATDDAFRADAQWMLNFAFPFGEREWDVMAAMPDAADPGAMMEPRRAEWWRLMILGKDLAPLARPAGDKRPVENLVDGALFPLPGR